MLAVKVTIGILLIIGLAISAVLALTPSGETTQEVNYTMENVIEETILEETILWETVQIEAWG